MIGFGPQRDMSNEFRQSLVLSYHIRGCLKFDVFSPGISTRKWVSQCLMVRCIVSSLHFVKSFVLLTNQDFSRLFILSNKSSVFLINVHLRLLAAKIGFHIFWL